MTLEELKLRIDTHLELNPKAKDWEVVIPVIKPAQGPTPCVEIESSGMGSDWNRGKYFINPTVKLKTV